MDNINLKHGLLILAERYKDSALWCDEVFINDASGPALRKALQSLVNVLPQRRFYRTYRFDAGRTMFSSGEVSKILNIPLPMMKRVIEMLNYTSPREDREFSYSLGLQYVSFQRKHPRWNVYPTQRSFLFSHHPNKIYLPVGERLLHGGYSLLE